MNNAIILFLVTGLVFVVVSSVSYYRDRKIKDYTKILFESVLIVAGLVSGVSLIVFGLWNQIMLDFLSEIYVRYMIAVSGAGIIFVVLQQFYKDYIEKKDTP